MVAKLGDCVSEATECDDDEVVTECPVPATSTQRTSSSSSVKGVGEIRGKDLTAYPVPFRDKTTVEFKSERAGNYVINLYDLKGQLITELEAGKSQAGEIQKVEVDGRNLPEGMYFIRVVDSAGSRSVKLLKK